MKLQTELFESAFKFSGIGFALVSTEGRWLRVNDSLIKIVGYTKEELEELTFADITHPDDIDHDMTLLHELIVGARANYQMEKRYIHKDGHVVSILLNVSAIRNEDGSPKYFVSQIQDISELKATQAKLQNNAKLVALGEMAAGIAHEINNPLTIISLHATAVEHLVAEKELNREMLGTFTGKISETVKRISGIVSSLRKFSGDSTHSTVFEVLPLEQVVRDTLGLCTEKFKAAGVTLTTNIPAGLEVECNALDISQVLVNLINNSFYAVQHEMVKTITISAEKVRSSLVISVMDSGPGIPESIRSRLLDPFFTTKPNGKGTGLGLSISKNIVENHQGELFLDESCPQTNFVVRIPLSQTHSKKRSVASKTASSMLPM